LVIFGKTEEILSGIAKMFKADEIYAEMKYYVLSSNKTSSALPGL